MAKPELPELPPRFLELAKAIGLAADTIYEFCQATGTSPEEFFGQFGRNP